MFFQTFKIILVICIYALIAYQAVRAIYGGGPDANIIWALLILQALRLSLHLTTDSLTISLGITYFAIFFFPSIGLIVFFGIYPVYSIAFFIIFFDLLCHSNNSLTRSSITYPDNLSRSSIILFFVLIAWMIVSSYFMTIGLITLVAPLSISAVVLEMMLRTKRKRLLTLFALIAYSAVFLNYLLVHWSGFGRLVIGSYIIFIALVLMQYVDLKFRLWMTPLMLPYALYIAQASRYGSVNDLSTLLVGSAGHHMMVTEDARVMAIQGNSQGISAFFDQFLLMFFNWFPRSLWPDKPIGAGLTSVDFMYGRAQMGVNYSQSLGFLGEQYYLIGSFAFLGIMGLLPVLILLRQFIRRFSGSFITPIAAFDASLISFFWGGMANFGSRVWFLTIPGLLYLIYRRSRFRKKSR